MLNYSVCCFEILDKRGKAKDMAKKAFDDSVSKLTDLNNSDNKDSTLIMQLLRDNLTIWSSEEEEMRDQENHE